MEIAFTAARLHRSTATARDGLGTSKARWELDLSRPVTKLSFLSTTRLRVSPMSWNLGAAQRENQLKWRLPASPESRRELVWLCSAQSGWAWRLLGRREWLRQARQCTARMWRLAGRRQREC